MKKLLVWLFAITAFLFMFTSCQKDDVSFDESLLIGKWVSETDYLKFNEVHSGFSWNKEKNRSKTFTWIFVQSNESSINIIEAGNTATIKYTLVELTATSLKFIDNSGISYTYTKDTEIFDESLLVGKWLAGTKYLKFNNVHNGTYWNTDNGETEITGFTFAWSFDESDQVTLHIVETGSTITKEYIIIELTITTLKLIDSSGNLSLYRIAKEVTFDESLLYGKWVSGTLYFRYISDHTGYTWDLLDDVVESEAQPFTWTLIGSDLLHIYIMQSGGNVPQNYSVTELTVTTLKYHDDFGVVHTFTKI